MFFLLCSAFAVIVYVNIKENVASFVFADAFIVGHICGTTERVLNVRLANLSYKIPYSIITILLRIILIPKIPVNLQVYQICLVFISMMINWSREKEEKSLFQKCYDYRESFTKFKNLVGSGLSTNIVILSKNLERQLFKNDSVMGITKIEEILEWLKKMVIERHSLSEFSGFAGLLRQKKIMSVYDVLNELKNWENSSFQQKILFNAKQSSSERLYEIKVFPIVWDGEDAITVILNDMTEHYLNLRLQVADHNKDRMLAMISHELRTPLNGIIGVVNFLKKEIKDPQQLRYLSVCKNSGELLLNLVNSILDLKQIRDKKFSLTLTKDNLYELLGNIYDLFKFQFDQKNLYLKLDISSEVPEQIITDQNRLRQILINLIGNALKFTFEGGVQVNVDLDPERRGFINFKVSDTGTGIKEEDMGKLFKMYGRLEQQDPKTNTQGVGLGLEISNQLAILLADCDGAGIKVGSKLGKGSSFCFSIRDNNVATENDSFSSLEEEINYYEPKIFAEGIEDIGLKITPYTHIINDCTQSPILMARSGSSSEISSIQSYMPSIALCGGSIKATDPQLSINFSLKRKVNLKLHRSYNNLHHHPKGLLSPSLSIRKGSSNLEATTANTPILEKGKSLVKSYENLKILIVDDNPFNLLVAKNIVESIGFMVDTALNGQKAIEEVVASMKIQPYSAILMDLQMPIMDGYEATKELRKMMERKEIMEIPIVALSANDTEDDKKKCKEAGMFDHLAKPLYEEKLRKILEKAFNRLESSLDDISP